MLEVGLVSLVYLDEEFGWIYGLLKDRLFIINSTFRKKKETEEKRTW